MFKGSIVVVHCFIFVVRSVVVALVFGCFAGFDMSLLDFLWGFMIFSVCLLESLTVGLDFLTCT